MKVLQLTNFDPTISTKKLVGNLQELNNFFQKQSAPFQSDLVNPVIEYFLETNELIASKNNDIQELLTSIFIYSFYLTAPNMPFSDTYKNVMYKIFHLISRGIQAMQERGNDKMIEKLLEVANEIEFFILPKENNDISELFESLIDINSQVVVSSIKQLIDSTTRIPSALLQTFYENLRQQKYIDIILKLSNAKQNELIQNIRTILHGNEAIDVFSSLSDLLELPSQNSLMSIRPDIESSDEETRLAAIKIFTKYLLSSQYTHETESYFDICVKRYRDQNKDIRLLIVKFIFSIIENSKKLKTQVIRIDPFLRQCWECIRELLKDPKHDVRLLCLKCLNKMNVKDIKLDCKEHVSNRLQDKTFECRNQAMKLMMKIYSSNVDENVWIEEKVIRLYYKNSPFKDVCLYAFDTLTEKRSIIDIAEEIPEPELKNLIALLKDSKTFRELLPHYQEREDEISKFVPVKDIEKAFEVCPDLLEVGLDAKTRHKTYQIIKKKIGSQSANLLLGYYQLSPLNPVDLRSCENESVVKVLSKIFASDFDSVISDMIQKMSKTDIIILSNFDHVFDEDVNHVISVLLDNINVKSKRKYVIKAISKLFRGCIDDVPNIKFSDKEFVDKVKFYSNILCNMKNPEVPKSLLSEIKKKISNLDKKGIKRVLFISKFFNGKDCIDFHLSLIDKYPYEAFDSYIYAAGKHVQHNTPDVFLKFVYLVINQNKTIRSKCIASLRQALTLPDTPIQFLPIFCLFAHDSDKNNERDASDALSYHIKLRRDIYKRISQANGNPSRQILPESSVPYLMYILSHHPEYDNDAPNFDLLNTYLKFFLKHITKGTNDYDSILEVFTDMNLAEDVSELHKDNHLEFCRFAIRYVRKVSGNKEWSQSNTNTVFELPTRYYQPCQNQDRIKETIAKTDFDIIKSPKFSRSPKGPKGDNLSDRTVTGKDLLKRVNLDEDPPGKKRKSRTAKKAELSDSSTSESDSTDTSSDSDSSSSSTKESVTKASKKNDPQKSPAKGKRRAKAPSSDDKETDEDEIIRVPQRLRNKTPISTPKRNQSPIKSRRSPSTGSSKTPSPLRKRAGIVQSKDNVSPTKEKRKGK